jgi:endonuclease/exonuclease/phosphatase family metal-dependent hydrolase
LITRFEILEAEASRSDNRVQKVLLHTPFGMVRVINIHAVIGDWKRRHSGIRDLLVDNALGEPLILGGDFNTTHQSATFQMVLGRLKNSHLEAGNWFGFSFPATQTYVGLFGRGVKVPAPTALFRIDHLFYSHHFKAVRAYTLKNSGGSDHYPVVAELSVVAALELKTPSTHPVLPAVRSVS